MKEKICSESKLHTEDIEKKNTHTHTRYYMYFSSDCRWMKSQLLQATKRSRHSISYTHISPLTTYIQTKHPRNNHMFQMNVHKHLIQENCFSDCTEQILALISKLHFKQLQNTFFHANLRIQNMLKYLKSICYVSGRTIITCTMVQSLAKGLCRGNWTATNTWSNNFFKVHCPYCIVALCLCNYTIFQGGGCFFGEESGLNSDSPTFQLQCYIRATCYSLFIQF